MGWIGSVSYSYAEHTMKRRSVILTFFIIFECSCETRIHAFVPASTIATTATTFIPSSNINHDSSGTSPISVSSSTRLYLASKAKAKLTRPERKALERKKKQQRSQNNKNNDKNNPQNKSKPQKGKRNHNYAERSEFLTEKHKGESSGKYNLHSEKISKLTSSSTADEVLQAIKRAQNLHDQGDLRIIEKFLLEEVDEHFAYGYRGSLLARLAVAALHMSNQQLARDAIVERRAKHSSSMLPMESAAIIRGLLRVHNVTDAIEILDQELVIPEQADDYSTPEGQEVIRHRALSLCSIASRHFFEGEPCMATNACDWLAELGPIVRQSGLSAEELNMPWDRILRGAAQCESGRRDGSVVPVIENVKLSCNLVYSVLKAMSTFPSDNKDRVYEILSNALIRRTLFVTGAVNMDGCPQADRGEVMFIGRSNVGKSSLVNMVTNRKSLAYTSKRPGKTQQFNFFAVNDKPGREKEIKYGDVVKGEKDADSFYIVDVPGFGFAKVPEKIRRDWSSFLKEFVSHRKTLKVVFHLVDARHGPTDEDANIMSQMSKTLNSKQTKYVVVLTKADKNVKGATAKNSGKVRKEVLHKLRQTMKQSQVGNSPVILTSAETKLGRDEMWRFMRLAAES